MTSVVSAAGVEIIHILWTGRGTVSVTGTFPGSPDVHLRDEVLGRDTGDELMAVFRRAVHGDLEPFILVIEGTGFDEDADEGARSTLMGDDPETGEPITLADWLDRLVHRAWAVVAIGTSADRLGRDFRPAVALPIGNVPSRSGGVPACPVKVGCRMSETPLPVADEPPGARLTSTLLRTYGPFVRALRLFAGAASMAGDRR